MDLVPFSLMEILDKSQDGLHPNQVQYIVQEIIKALYTIHSKVNTLTLLISLM